tara:strand:+ start:48352 stop:48468 length:117 start_codon:yes stop_codon:yes gene_type:complete
MIKTGLVEDNPQPGQDTRDKLEMGEGVTVIWYLSTGGM